MRKPICRRCGGHLFRADRSLAGRLVCCACGSPFIEGKFIKSANDKYIGLKRPNPRKTLMIGVVVLIIIIILFL